MTSSGIVDPPRIPCEIRGPNKLGEIHEAVLFGMFAAWTGLLVAY